MQAQDMSTIIKALMPAFAAGVAVQQLLEILDPIVVLIFKAPNKKLVLGIISFVTGVFLAWSFNEFLIVKILIGGEPNRFIDVLVSGLILSAGTEGFNSIIKFVGYAKENKKGEAAASKGGAAGALEKVSKNDAGAN